MRLREWDPRHASEAELASWLDAYNASVAAELPADPPWGMDRLRDYLSVTMPGEDWQMRIAEAESGAIAGYGGLLMHAGMGVLELFVVPDHRRRGVGRALLTELAELAVARGFLMLGVEVAGGTSAMPFYEANGFTHVYTETRAILDLTTVDWSRVAEMAAGVAAGYRIACHRYELPDHMLAAYAETKQMGKLGSGGDLELRPSSYDVERLRVSLRCLAARGLTPYMVVAVHERTRKVAGLTELVVPQQRPSRADQYDTVIDPAHSSYGLARAIKARMLLELHAAEPRLRQVQTWYATERKYLQQLNLELGFDLDREWREYEADARQVARRPPGAG